MEWTVPVDRVRGKNHDNVHLTVRFVRQDGILRADWQSAPALRFCKTTVRFVKRGTGDSTRFRGAKLLVLRPSCRPNRSWHFRQ